MISDNGNDAWEAFRQRLRERRREMDLTQGDLAERLTAAGMPANNVLVSKIEAGARRVDLAEAAVIAEVLGMSVGAMVDNADDVAVGEQAALQSLLDGVVEARDRYEAAGRSLEDARAAVSAHLRAMFDAGGARPFLLGMHVRLHPDDLAGIETGATRHDDLDVRVVDLTVGADERRKD